MKATELIAELTRRIEEYGDLPVYQHHEDLPGEEVNTVMPVGAMNMTTMPHSTDPAYLVKRPEALILSQW